MPLYLAINNRDFTRHRAEAVMAYQKSFKLDVNDLDLIETALRKQAAEDLRVFASYADSGIGIPGKSSEIQTLLGKLHQQKIFYSQVQRNGIPNG